MKGYTVPTFLYWYIFKMLLLLNKKLKIPILGFCCTVVELDSCDISVLFVLRFEQFLRHQE